MNNFHLKKPSYVAKLLVWFNIVVQSLFPVVWGYYPSVVAAQQKDSMAKPVIYYQQTTRPYILGNGETTESVAKKYNISLQALKELNQFRTFAHGFEHLQQGDELDVPLRPLSADREEHVGPRSDHQVTPQEQKLAVVANQTGSLANNSTVGKAASSVARGMATSVVNNNIETWLNRFGKARVQLNTNDDFSLKNSQFDFLVPLYDRDDKLFFTQNSWHRTDDRTQVNLGLGARWFENEYMLGGNTFLDYDLSREHARIGFGAEYWRDFMKMSANTYFRLTDWKNSTDLEDYQERPANGWGIQAEGWLPAWPELGGKLSYEKYYGDDVGLFGKEHRQHNPHALGAGMSYTPFPLLSFTAERLMGKDGKSDSRLGLQLNYQPGVPLREQLTSDAVSAMHKLAGSRYDFVDRNNNIVLEYRKKEVIRLHTAPLITGYAGQTKSLEVAVNSKYELSRIDWTAPALLAAGGKIIQHSDTSYSVLLPDYQSGPEGTNTYVISGIAVDAKGNVSHRAETQVTVTQAAINTDKSFITPAEALLPADGKTQQQLMLNVRDRDGNQVDINENEISVAIVSKTRGNRSATLSAFSRQAPGQYSATLTAGTKPESLEIIPSARNTRLASSHITLTANAGTAYIDSIEVVENNAIANGKAQNKISMVVMDAEGNRVPFQSINLKASNEASISGSISTDRAGVATVPVTSTHAGNSIVTADINGAGRKEVTLNFLPDKSTAQITENNFSVTPDISVADGVTTKQVTTLVTDAQGNPVPDIEVTFAVDSGAVLADKAVKTESNGRAQTTLTSVIAGTVHITAQVNNHRVSKTTTFTGNNATALVAAVTPSKGPYIADGVSKVTFSALVTDKNGNPLPGVAVDWKSDRDASQVVFTAIQSYTNDKGVAQTAITSTHAYAVSVTASTNASLHTADPVTFTANPNDGRITELSADRYSFIANGKDQATLTARVQDSLGNPLSHVAVSLSVSNDAELRQPGTSTDEAGMFRVMVASTKAGEITIEARLKNGQSKTISLMATADTKTATVNVVSSAPTAIVGQEEVTLTATVKDDYHNPVPHTRIAWRSSQNSVSEAVAETDKLGQATVKLSGTKAGITTVTAQLYNGNANSTDVLFQPGEPDNLHSTLRITPQSVSADGVSYAEGTLTLKDAWDNLIPGQDIVWNANEPDITFTKLPREGKGTYRVRITGKKEGVWSVTAAKNNVSKTVSLNFLANQTTARITSVNVSGADTAKADGQDKVIIRAQVKDEHGNVSLPGVSVGWETTLGQLSSVSSETDSNGIAEIALTSAQSGRAIVSAVLGGQKPVKADNYVTFAFGTVSAETSSVEITPDILTAGADKATVYIKLKDAQGNSVTGIANALSLHYSEDLGITTGTFSESTPGVYVTQLTGNKAGTTRVIAYVNRVPVLQTAKLTITADSNSAKVSGSIKVSAPTALVGEQVRYTTILTDQYGNTLTAGIPVTWSADNGSQLSDVITYTNEKGQTYVTLTRSLAGVAKVKANLHTGETTQAPDVVFSAGIPDESQSELTLAPATIIAGKESATMALVLKDKYGNPLSGQVVTGESNNSSVAITPGQESKAGYYTMTVTGSRAGMAELSVKVNNVAFSQKKTLKITGDNSSWHIEKVVADTTSFIAGDSHGVTYRAYVRDSFGNKLPDVVVSWRLEGQADSFEPTSRTDAEGIASKTVTSSAAGTLIMSAYLDDTNYFQAGPVTVIPGEISPTASSFSTDKTVIGADGIETAVLTVTLNDAYGNAISGKQVTIEGASTLPGFVVSKVNDEGRGVYRALATSTAKGEVTLTAKADGKAIGSAINIVVGAITPSLSFANEQQQTVYTKNFTESQPVKGMPDGLVQIWSSSAPDVARVDKDTGTVTLLKAGETRITVHTPGNTQYNPAMASYMLAVKKAKPGLMAGNGQPVNATWADGKTYTIAASFSNDDVGNTLQPIYRSENPQVVTVNENGTLVAVKPGTTTVNVSTPETEQFEADSASVAYVLNKATLDVTFKETVTETTDESSFTLQQPETALPPDAKYAWESSNSKVINLSTTGEVLEQVHKGHARLRLNITASDYYNSSSGYYDVNVYSRPSIGLGELTYISNSSPVSSGKWTPVFTDDYIKIAWSADASDEYSKPVAATVYLKDNSGKVLASKRVETPSGSYTTPFPPEPDFWGKEVYVEVVAEGHAGLKDSKKSRSVGVSNLTPSQIWRELTVKSYSDIRVNTSDHHESQGSCQELPTGWRHDIYAVIKSGKLRFNGKQLLKPMTIQGLVSSTQNGENYVTEALFPWPYNDVYSDTDMLFGERRIAEKCWSDHIGGYRIGISITYNNREYRYMANDSHGWGGNGDGNRVTRTDVFAPQNKK